MRWDCASARKHWANDEQKQCNAHTRTRGAERVGGGRPPENARAPRGIAARADARDEREARGDRRFAMQCVDILNAMGRPAGGRANARLGRSLEIKMELKSDGKEMARKCSARLGSRNGIRRVSAGGAHTA